MSKSYVPTVLGGTIMMNNGISTIANNEISTTENTYLVTIKEIAANAATDADAFNDISNYLSAERGALKWLIDAKENYNDHIVINKNFSFNPSDMIGCVIRKRVKALERVAYDVNLLDVLKELEDVAWCCGVAE